MGQTIPNGQVAVWGARGGQGTTTVAAVLAALWGTALDSPEPWEAEWILGPELSASGDDSRIVIDSGVLGTKRVASPDTFNLVVLRGPCLVAVRSVSQHAEAVDCLVVVREPWRASSSEEVERVIDVPVAFEVPFSERIARMTDAGLLGTRLDKLEEFAALRAWATNFRPIHAES